MTRAPSSLPLIAKEFRALLPIWVATMAALVAAFLWRRNSFSDLGLIGYGAGVVAIGAHAFGHEYGHRTLPMLLVQPVTRWRLIAAKYLTAGALLATLAAGAALVLRADGFRGNDSSRFIILPIVAAVFAAPLFAMICRNTLAGAILGTSGPMTLWVIAILVAWMAFAVPGEILTARLVDRWVPLALFVCPILGALTWRTSGRLEAVDGTPISLSLPNWLGARAGVRRAAPWRALLAKEIHLQQLTIAITVVYCVIWAMGMVWRDSAPPAVILPLEAVLLLYCLGLAIVIGAVASAEERQQGTLDVQLLQPVGAWKQWALKSAVSLVLAVLLGVAMPAVLITLMAPVDASMSTRAALATNITLVVVVLTSSSLYISSLVSSGVKAMAWSLPVGIGVAIFIQTSRSAVVLFSTRLGAPLPADHTEAALVAARVLTVLMVPALLWFGFVNHTAADHPLRRTLAQVGVLAALIVAGIAASGMLI